MRTNKQVLFDPLRTSKVGHTQYGLTGFLQAHQAGRKFTAGAYTNEEMGSTSFNASGEQQNSMLVQKNEAVSTRDYYNQIVTVEKNEGYAALGADYVDSHISLARTPGREAQSSSSDLIDVQRAFKNRVLQYQQLKSTQNLDTKSGRGRESPEPS